MPVTDISDSVAAVVLTRLWDPATRQVGYAVKIHQTMAALTSAMEELNAKRDDVVDALHREMHSTSRQLHHWLTKVDTVQREVDAITRRYNQHPSLNYLSIYKTGRRAAKKLQRVLALRNDEAPNAVSTSSSPHPGSVQEMPSTQTVLGMEKYLREAIGYIRDDEAAGGVIGIWGMGGVGKTTLLKEINNSCHAGYITGFDYVIWLVASRDCNQEKVQRDVAMRLGLPSFSDASILNFLKNKNFLILLDDLWDRLDLVDIGIPHPLCGGGRYRRKVVLTTRSEDVCGNMEAHRRIRVDCLKWDDAWRLFKDKVGDGIINEHSDPRITRLAKEVAKECDGLPLALTTAGRAMSTKRSPDHWEHAVELLRSSRLPEIPGTEKNTFPLLKFSYDYLQDDRTRECFLCCALWPEDFSIAKDELIECWMGLGLIDDFDGIDEAYRTGHSLIASLLAYCLLEPSDDDLNEVKMHDVIRDLALWIVSDYGNRKKRWIVRAGVALWTITEKCSKTVRVSLMHNKLKMLSSISSRCPDLTTLMLQHNDLSHGDPLQVCEFMPNLTYLDLSYTKIRTIPPEVCFLAQLQYLNVSSTCITSLPDELGQLTNLKYLYARDNNFQSIPHRLTLAMRSLLVIDLYNSWKQVDINEDYYIPMVIRDLKHFNGELRALGICVSTLPTLRNLIGLPVRSLCIQRLEGVTALNLMSTGIFGGANIQHQQLKELCISHCGPFSLRKLVFEGRHCSPAKLKIFNLYHLSMLDEIKWNSVTPRFLFQNLCKVIIRNCDSLNHVNWVLKLPCLDFLELFDCSKMRRVIESIVEDSDGDDHSTGMSDVEEEEEDDDDDGEGFVGLRTLRLINLPELDGICDVAMKFARLKYVEVLDCPKLKKLPFRLETARSELQKIQGSEQWWEGLEWEDERTKDSFLPFFQQGY